ncbi:MAG: hypothetical protein FJ284_16205, partial [Planctomycetes bacterium]|nr:hypothetical protein [Planctomycetota bacterium]
MNDLFAQAADPEAARMSSRPTGAQQECQRFVFEACRAAGRPPFDLTPAEALRELRIAGPYAEDAPLGPVTFDPAKISLPPEGNKPVSIDVLWGVGGPEFLERFSQHCLAPMVVVQEQMRDAPAVPYTDVSFNCKAVWEEFVWRLARAGLVDFADEVTEVTGVFCVPKKDGRQRLVLDARRSNCWFTPAEGVSLCTGSALASIEMNPSETLFIGQGDVQDAFYHLQLPPGLRGFFGLRPVRRSRVPPDLRGLIGDNKSERLFPRVAVVPMGFSWALWLFQQIHQRAARRAGCGNDSRLRDRQPWQPGLAVRHSEYVDNFVALGSSKVEVGNAVNSVVGELRRIGLPVHEIETGCTQAKVLGWEINGLTGTIRPSSSRLWRVRLAFRHVL